MREIALTPSLVKTYMLFLVRTHIGDISKKQLTATQGVLSRQQMSQTRPKYISPLHEEGKFPSCPQCERFGIWIQSVPLVLYSHLTTQPNVRCDTWANDCLQELSQKNLPYLSTAFGTGPQRRYGSFCTLSCHQTVAGIKPRKCFTQQHRVELKKFDLSIDISFMTL